eukprot:2196524-Amphidinium_carterae.1
MVASSCLQAPPGAGDPAIVQDDDTLAMEACPLQDGQKWLQKVSSLPQTVNQHWIWSTGFGRFVLEVACYSELEVRLAVVLATRVL